MDSLDEEYWNPSNFLKNAEINYEKVEKTTKKKK